MKKLTNCLKMDDQKIIITIRLIRSFHYRNIKPLVLKDVDKHLKVKELKELINKGLVNDELCFKLILFNHCFKCLTFDVQELKHANLPPPFKTYVYGK